MQILVQDTSANPLPDAHISAIARGKGTNRLNQKFITDATGMALVRYPDADLQTLEVSAEHDGYGGRKMLWNLATGDTVPSSYTLKLGPEATIGGFVVDTNQTPVAGATISLYRFWSGGDNPIEKVSNRDFYSQNPDDGRAGPLAGPGAPARFAGPHRFRR